MVFINNTVTLSNNRYIEFLSFIASAVINLEYSGR